MSPRSAPLLERKESYQLAKIDSCCVAELSRVELGGSSHLHVDKPERTHVELLQ